MANEYDPWLDGTLEDWEEEIKLRLRRSQGIEVEDGDVISFQFEDGQEFYFEFGVKGKRRPLSAEFDPTDLGEEAPPAKAQKKEEGKGSPPRTDGQR